MPLFKEIVTKAVIGKGKKLFKDNYMMEVENKPTTILGCWVINHKFKGYKTNDKIGVSGSYDVNIWYSYDNDTKTEVLKQSNEYLEMVHMRDRDSDDDEEIIFLHKVKDGPVDKSYGINVARLAHLPDELLNRAQSILNELEKNKESQ